jgi:hypothetical protein
VAPLADTGEDTFALAAGGRCSITEPWMQFFSFSSDIEISRRLLETKRTAAGGEHDLIGGELAISLSALAGMTNGNCYPLIYAQ